MAGVTGQRPSQKVGTRRRRDEPHRSSNHAAQPSDRNQESLRGGGVDCKGWWLILGGVLIVVLATASVYYVWLNSRHAVGSPQPQPEPLETMQPEANEMGTTTVRVVTLVQPDINYSEYASLDAPVVLRGSVVQTWPAFEKWTVEFLARQLPQVTAYVRPTPEFITWHDDKPLAPHVRTPGGSWQEHNMMVNVSTHTVLHGSSEPPFHYFSDEILKLQGAGFTSLVKDLQPLRPLAPTETGLQVNLWFGAAPVQTYTHYDASHNAFAQLHGRKRFTLFPPDAAMYPWPCLHPHIGHSQVDWRRDQLGGDRFPLFDPAAAVTVEVGRGDLLILPPYWWHHVETIASPSVSVNVWSDAAAYALLDDAYTVPLPLDAEWEPDVRASTALAFLRLVVASVVAFDATYASTIAFAADLFNQRWKLLLDANHIAAGNTTAEHMHELCQAPPRNKAKTVERASTVLERFAKMEPKSVRLLSLGNYVERVAAAVIGPESTGLYIKVCLAESHDRIIKTSRK